MSPWGRKLQKTARALGVAAFVLLNFGHAHVAAQMPAPEAPVAVADASTCGAPALDQCKDHAPRRFCRTAIYVDLPPAPCAIEPARRVALPVHYTTDRPAIVLRTNWRAFAPRAPPALV